MSKKQSADARVSGAGDGNRTNPTEPNKGVTTRFSVQLESNPSARATVESKLAPSVMVLTEGCRALTLGGLSESCGREQKVFESDPQEKAPGYMAEEKLNGN
jgi:hypothetical protein